MTAPTRSHGFTLIELVMVLVLLGVLAIALVPRINSQDFSARGFHDETLSFLRYAQKTAIAQRRTVCVAFTVNSVTLTVVAVPASTDCLGVGSTVPLTGPNGETPAAIPTPVQQQRYMNGITYSQFPPAVFFFDGLGRPSAGQVIQVASSGVAIPQTITVEAGTGYVHD